MTYKRPYALQVVVVDTVKVEEAGVDEEEEEAQTMEEEEDVDSLSEASTSVGTFEDHNVSVGGA